MPEFIMMVGIPGCGKSHKSNELAADGYAIHSSDALREELNMHEPNQSGIIFDTMHKNIQKDMIAGKNIVYDATNLARKRRIAYLESIKKFGYKKICYLFMIPVDVCKERNAKRTGYAFVPDYVYDRMLRSYEVPMLEEGWDEIVPIYSDFNYDLPDMNISQDNPHHTLTLAGHMDKAYHSLSDDVDDLIAIATKYHDIGKIYTKKFENYKGEPTEHAHYYGHENYGAYIFLVLWASKYSKIYSFDKALHIAQLINWHMAPFLRWDKSAKTYEKDLRLLGQQFIDEIDIIHEADLYAH